MAHVHEYNMHNRLVGRVYRYNDAMHFVLSVDENSGFARVSCRYGQRTEVRYIPITEVSLRVANEIP
jgi:hypothetical protein